MEMCGKETGCVSREKRGGESAGVCGRVRGKGGLLPFCLKFKCPPAIDWKADGKAWTGG